MFRGKPCSQARRGVYLYLLQGGPSMGGGAHSRFLGRVWSPVSHQQKQSHSPKFKIRALLGDPADCGVPER